MANASFDPPEHVVESVMFRGTAWNAAAGATVSVAGSKRPIYIAGSTPGVSSTAKTVGVSGMLRLPAADAPPPETGDLPLHGLDTATFVLDSADWAPAGEG